MRHLTNLFDVSAEEIEQIFSITEELKTALKGGDRQPRLPGLVVALLFEKPSLRTRVSFEAGTTHLGGHCLHLGPDAGWGERESAADFTRALSRYVDVIVCRARKQEVIGELTRYSSCSIINGLTDRYHPCQALADVYTLRERHAVLSGQKIAYVGDANNVARSLAIAAGKLGITMALAAPDDYQFDATFLRQLEQKVPSAELIQTNDPAEAVEDAICVYTDVWASMGQESETAERASAFQNYQVNAQLMSWTSPDTCFMHCLPAHRGQEVTDEVIDGPKSAVFDQAENRMHVQKGLLAFLLDS